MPKAFPVGFWRWAQEYPTRTALVTPDGTHITSGFGASVYFRRAVSARNIQRPFRVAMGTATRPAR